MAVTKLRADLWKHGYRPVAICNHDSNAARSPGKRPVGLEWERRARLDPPDAALREANPAALNTGILCDGFRAIDVDFDDVIIASEIRGLLEHLFGETIVRLRDNSGKFLALYRAAEGTPAKRTLAAEAGKIEVLGLGQQFVAYGTHVTGVPLVWDATGSPLSRHRETLPAITEQQIDTFFAQAMQFTGPAVARTSAPDARTSTFGLVGNLLDIESAVAQIPNADAADWDHWNHVGLLVYAATDGESEGLEIWDRWSELHPSYDAEAVVERWEHFSQSPPTRGGIGSLVHMARTANPDWRQPSRGAGDGSEFEALPADAEPVADDQDWETMLFRNDKGNPRPGVPNTTIALRHAPEWRGVIAIDDFACKLMLTSRPPWVSRFTRFVPREVREDDFSRIVCWLANYGVSANSTNTLEAAAIVGRDNAYNPAQDWLAGLLWDGTPRLNTWLADYLGAHDTPLNRAFGSKFLIAAAARIRDPGCQVDTVLVLEGEQGIRKSTALRVLAGNDWFTDHMPDLHSKDAPMQIQGVSIVEHAELDKLGRADANRAKSFITTRFDRFRPPYGKVIATFPRQCVFAATVNPGATGYLKDETGNRRYWPVECGFGWQRGRTVDTDALAANRDQLWAEAASRHAAGEVWYLDDIGLQTEQASVAEQRVDLDIWTDVIADIVSDKPFVTTSDVLADMRLHHTGKEQTRAVQMRVVTVLHALGWRRSKIRVIGALPRNVYVPPGSYGPKTGQCEIVRTSENNQRIDSLL